MTDEPNETPITDEALQAQLRECGPFRPGSAEASAWKAMYGKSPIPPPSVEGLARIRANVERWQQEQRDHDAIEILTRLS